MSLMSDVPMGSSLRGGVDSERDRGSSRPLPTMARSDLAVGYK